MYRTMIASHLFNEQKGNDVRVVYGAVTTGTNWRFLKLDAKCVYIDHDEYYINKVGKILSIFTQMIGEVP